MQAHMEVEITLEQLIARVENCGTDEVDAVFDALRRRYRGIFPGWEVVFEAYPVKKEDKDRKPRLTLLKKQNDA
jgi:hypothetical protein